MYGALKPMGIKYSIIETLLLISPPIKISGSTPVCKQPVEWIDLCYSIQFRILYTCKFSFERDNASPATNLTAMSLIVSQLILLVDIMTQVEPWKYSSVYFTAKTLAATLRLKLLCRQSNIWSHGITQFEWKSQFLIQSACCL